MITGRGVTTERVNSTSEWALLRKTLILPRRKHTSPIKNKHAGIPAPIIMP